MFRPKDRHGRAMYTLMRARDVTDDAMTDCRDCRPVTGAQKELAWRIATATLALSSALIESALDDLRGGEMFAHEKHDAATKLELNHAAPIQLAAPKG